MLKAIIFDCDGVIADTEPLHFAAFQRVLAEEGFTLTEEEYLKTYLAFDDRGCFTTALSPAGAPLAAEKLAELIARKSAYIDPMMQTRLRAFPGVTAFIHRLAERYPLAVASGALRREVEMILDCADVRDCFQEIVTAEDVARGKPDPESFLQAAARLNARNDSNIEPGQCLVVEDSKHGVRAGRRAGMKVLAVTNSYPKAQLAEADLIVESLDGLRLTTVEALFAD
jgi:HAD superfamily hydrolase (TIGR01509 family)